MAVLNLSRSLPDQVNTSEIPPNANSSSVAIWAEAILVLAVSLIGLAMFPIAIMGTDLQFLPADELDSRFNNWVLEHGYQYVTFQTPNFWSAPSFYPVPLTLTLSDCHIGTLPIYSTFRISGFDRETSYQLWFLALCVLNFVIAYATLRGFGALPLAAAAGAYVFAFGFQMQCSMCHLQLAPRMGVPLVFYWTWRFTLTGQTRYILGTGLAFVWQLYATIYVAYFLGLCMLGFLGASVLVYRRVWPAQLVRFGSRDLIFRAAVVLACALLAYPLIRVYTNSAIPEYIESNIKDIPHTMPRWADWTQAPPDSEFWGWTFSGHSTTAHLFFGGMTSLGFLTLIRPSRNNKDSWRVGLLAGGSLLGAVVLTLNLGGWSPYWLLTKLPGVPAIRAVYRIQVAVLFPAAILTAVLLTRVQLGLSERFRPCYGAIASLFLLTLTIGELHLRFCDSHHFSKLESQTRVNRLVERIKSYDPDVKSVVLLYPDDGAESMYGFCVAQMDIMLAAQSIGIATPNGYSGHTPPRWPIIRETNDVQRWRILAAQCYDSERPGLMRYYRQHHFDHLLVLGPENEAYSFVPGTQCMGPIPPEERKADLSFVGVKEPWRAAKINRVCFRVTNQSNLAWHALGIQVPGGFQERFDRYCLSVNYRWLTSDGKEVEGCNAHAPSHLDSDLPAGGSTLIKLHLHTPPTAGEYLLEVGIRQEGLPDWGWFHDAMKTQPLRVPVTVLPSS